MRQAVVEIREICLSTADIHEHRGVIWANVDYGDKLKKKTICPNSNQFFPSVPQKCNDRPSTHWGAKYSYVCKL